MAEGFATKGEAMAACRYLRSILERLPTPSFALGRVVGGVQLVEGLIRSTQTCNPKAAVGTRRYREVHGLEPLEDDQ